MSESGAEDEKMLQAEEPEDYYPHPLDDNGENFSAITFREQVLRQFSAAVRDKTNWTEKIEDRKLVAKWLREAKGFGDVTYSHKVLTWDKDDVEVAYKELRERYKPYVEQLRKEGSTIEPDIDGVWRTDSLVDEELRQQLIDAVATLENVPEEEKDWHPGGDGSVLDLVHPSLWPIIYGRSINIKDGKPIQLPEELENEEGYSNEFCWLPSEFEISPDGKETKIASYINNLSSPEQQKLFYPILEKIFTKFVPLFNHVLGDLRSGTAYLARAYSPYHYTYDNEEVEWLTPENHDRLWDELLEQFVNGEEMTVNFKDAIETFEGEDGDERREEYQEGHYRGFDAGDDSEFFREAPFEIRDLGQIGRAMWSAPTIGPKTKLEGKTVKVIVKLANIVLTPENPTYAGGSWHVEAMKNERIISTGIYYYDQENVTNSELAFRRTIGDMDDMNYHLPQDSNWTTVHNMSREGNSVQEIGSIVTKNNRAIAFPNIMQHQVQPFELADKTRPGYRKILVFFLCDPSPFHNVPTTKIVAPQQPEARQYVVEALREGPLGHLPEEVFRLIVDELPPQISKEEAVEIRENLMDERSAFNEDSEMVNGAHYSL
ncbi:hypothetical protein ABW19_dt0207207 [Dactylella cylindrospora]|nr:hypothetical protein ABW19_dt0207207 [Dactylella cylindrospora]